MFAFRGLRTMVRVSPIAAGAVLGGSSFFLLQKRSFQPVFNEAPASLAQYAAPPNGRAGLSRFNGKLDYHQLTFGSFAGMVSGYLFGRISKMLVGFIVTGLMGAEYLALTGRLDLRPLYSGIYRWCRAHLQQEVLVDDPSFKYSFALAFVISAYNA